MVKVLEQDVLLLRDADNFFSQKIIVKKLAYLEADLGIFVRIKRCNT